MFPHCVSHIDPTVDNVNSLSDREQNTNTLVYSQICIPFLLDRMPYHFIPIYFQCYRAFKTQLNFCLFQEYLVFPIHFLTPSLIFEDTFRFLLVLHVLSPKNIS